MKRCAKCKTVKPFDEFGVDNNRKDGRNPYCKACRRDKIALLNPRFSRLVKKCAECKKELPTLKFGTRMKRGVLVLHVACKPCMLERYRKWARTRRKNHPERERLAIKEASAKRRREDPERKRRECREWYSANLERARISSRRSENNRRALKKNAFIESIDPDAVFDRANGICGICKSPVSKSKPWHVDHIVPLSLGGKHAYNNVQLAHPSCNLSKDARMVVGGG